MDQAINGFINHTITNLQGALDHQDPQIAWAVLKNLSVVVDSYIEALEEEIEMSDPYDTLGGSGD